MRTRERSEQHNDAESGMNKSSENGSHPHREPINLRKAYPLALRSIVRNSLSWIVLFLILVLAITILDTLRPALETMAEQAFLMVCTTLFFVGVILLAGKIIYECLYFHVYYYGIELEHLVISRGVFFKTRGSFPLARMADVYIHQTPTDLLFGLYNLRVTTPSPVAEHGAIDGLPSRRAVSLQNFLVALVNTTVTPVDEEAASDTIRSMKSTEDPSILGPSPEQTDPPRMSPEQLPENLQHTAQDSGKHRETHSRDEKTSQRSSTENNDSQIVGAEEVLLELKKTKNELKKTRRELIHAEDLLVRAQETFEQIQEEEGPESSHDLAHRRTGNMRIP